MFLHNLDEICIPILSLPAIESDPKKNSSHHIVHILHYIFSRLRAKSSQSRKTMRKKNKYMKIKSSKSLIFFSKQKHKKKLKICTPTLSNKIPDGDEILDLKKKGL